MSATPPAMKGTTPTATTSGFADTLAMWLVGEGATVADPSDFLSGYGLVKRGDGENIHAVIWFCDPA